MTTQQTISTLEVEQIYLRRDVDQLCNKIDKILDKIDMQSNDLQSHTKDNARNFINVYKKIDNNIDKLHLKVDNQSSEIIKLIKSTAANKMSMSKIMWTIGGATVVLTVAWEVISRWDAVQSFIRFIGA